VRGRGKRLCLGIEAIFGNSRLEEGLSLGIVTIFGNS
jgi:hypothetical protein